MINQKNFHRSARINGPLIARKTIGKPPQSKLSRGPKNSNHKTFRENEENIINALCLELSKRHIDIKAKEIYMHAGVTSPTFYLHHHTSNDALRDHERKLKRQFYRSLPSDSRSEVIYAKLTNLIVKNQNYFLATINNNDYYLLRKLIAKYRYNLVGKKTSDRTFRHYVGSALATIDCWLQLDGITPRSTKACANQLAKLRPKRYW